MSHIIHVPQSLGCWVLSAERPFGVVKNCLQGQCNNWQDDILLWRTIQLKRIKNYRNYFCTTRKCGVSITARISIRPHRAAHIILPIGYLYRVYEYNDIASSSFFCGSVAYKSKIIHTFRESLPNKLDDKFFVYL